MSELNHPGDEPSKAVQAICKSLNFLLEAPATFLKGKAEASRIRSIARAQSEATGLTTQDTIRDETRLLEHRMNVGSIARKAAEQIHFQADDAPKLLGSGPEQDPGWFSRFADDARHVYDDELQNMWAKLLAGKISTPSRYSLRLIRSLSELNVQEARAFNTLADYITVKPDGSHVHPRPLRHAFFDARGLTRAAYESLAEAGLLFIGGILRRGADYDSQYFGKTLKEWLAGKGKTEMFRAHSLTTAGRELWTICEPTFQAEYIESFCIPSS